MLNCPSVKYFICPFYGEELGLKLSLNFLIFINTALDCFVVNTEVSETIHSFLRSHSKNNDPADNQTQVKLTASTGKDKSSKIAVIKTAQANKGVRKT